MRSPSLARVPAALAALRAMACDPAHPLTDAERETAAVLNVPVPLMQVPLSKAKALVFFPGLHPAARGAPDPLMATVAGALAPTCWMSVPPRAHVAWYAACESALAELEAAAAAIGGGGETRLARPVPAGGAGAVPHCSASASGSCVRKAAMWCCEDSPPILKGATPM